MKRDNALWAVVFIAATLSCCAGPDESAGRQGTNAPAGSFALLLERYDANRNGRFDWEEREAWRRDLARQPAGQVKRLVRNKDGKAIAAARSAARTSPKSKGKPDAATAAAAPKKGVVRG
jgi:hypothetical protein